MKSYHNPKKQNLSGNRFSSFLKQEDRLVKLLDESMIKNMFEARGRFDMNQNITGFTKDGSRIWTF